MSERVIWADDDVEGVLAPIIASVEGENTIDTARTFEAAIRGAQRIATEKPGSFVAVVDVVMGRERDATVPDWALGLTLGEELLRRGAHRLAFVTVVPAARISVAIARLRSEHKEARIVYYNKLELLETGRLQELAKFVWTGEV
jgi:hypothetical protein